jgi:di/tricarboxylate transporter
MTAFTDNAALTYLGSLTPISDSGKYFLLAGAVAGGGLTVIANAPNPVGYGILFESFGEKGIEAGKLFAAAIAPTLIALLCFWFLP